ncbi:UDP-glucosyltransferase 2-like [Anticarsia gemmatalis]|uniref:UDP-glucosyltransferase 2-like n=1 Tax=Anticarsia gemmatalis TaxID=129554 RepID=UPI003F75F4FC
MFVLIFIFAFATQSEAARILALIPTPSISHQVVFRSYTQELAKRGHEVVVITTDTAFPEGKTPPNFTEIVDHDMSYKIWQETFYRETSQGEGDLLAQMRAAFMGIIEIVEMQLNMPKVQKIIKEKFDLLLLEAWVRPALVLSHVHKVPVIQIGSFGFINDNVHTVGAAGHPILYPNTLSKRVYNLTKWEKMELVWELYRLKNLFDLISAEENAMAKRMFGPDIPSIDELRNNVDMMFLNIHPIWEGNRPVPPSLVYMWGVHERPMKELPQELKNYLDSSKNGVIYMSLGTNVVPSLLPPERVQMLIRVFSKMPYDVLLKWDKDELPGKTDNIRIFKWLPQSDLLRHPKIKVFITQGGLQSTDEAITAGVPLIGIPMLGDQWYNVEKYVYHGIGVQLDIKTLREEEFRNAIETVIRDDSYRRNILRLGELMRDEPMKPLDRAVWWTEYVLRHGGAKHLRSPAANISWTDYLELEIVLTMLLVFLVILLGIIIIVYYAYYFICNSKSKKTKQS